MKNRSAFELAAIESHLSYELKMFWATGHAMITGVTASPLLRNALVESFALHTRNLIDFFYGGASKGSVVAGHFFSKPRRWSMVRPQLSATLRNAGSRANKEISHLTYDRIAVTGDSKRWPVRIIVEEIDVVLAAFLAEADLLPENVKLLRYRSLLP